MNGRKLISRIASLGLAAVLLGGGLAATSLAAAPAPAHADRLHILYYPLEPKGLAKCKQVRDAFRANPAYTRVGNCAWDRTRYALYYWK